MLVTIRTFVIVLAVMASTTCVLRDNGRFCTSSDDCTSAEFPFCDVDGEFGPSNRCVATDSVREPDLCPVGKPYFVDGSCVECRMEADCNQIDGSAGYVCNERVCEKCSEHWQCESKICERSQGRCADPGKVAYVASSGATESCGESPQTPCGTIAAALALRREWLRIDAPGTYPAQISLSESGATLRVVGDAYADGELGITIQPPDGNTDEPVVDVSGDNVTFYAEGVVFTGVTGNDGAIHCHNNATLLLDRVKVSGNTGGGVFISNASFTIRNSFIVENGRNNSFFGGISVDEPNEPAVLQFNTISKNNSRENVTSGVDCVNSVPISANYNIVSQNLINDELAAADENTNCTMPTSLIDANPDFADYGMGDYHLKSDSTGVLNKVPAAEVERTYDFDNDPRPDTTSNMADYGADEYRSKSARNPGRWTKSAN